MSVKHSLLALLETEPMYGAQLKSEFERRTGGTWPLNVGQVYTTLGRLERDGLVESDGPPDEEGRIRYRLTDAGQVESTAWWDHAVDPEDQPRTELVIKLALAVTVPGVDVRRIVSTQRMATLRHLQQLNRARREVAPPSGGGTTSPTSADLSADALDPVARGLVLDHLTFSAESIIRWLDHVESTLTHEQRSRHRTEGQS